MVGEDEGGEVPRVELLPSVMKAALPLIPIQTMIVCEICGMPGGGGWVACDSMVFKAGFK